MSKYERYLRSSHWRNLKRRYRASKYPQKCKCGATERLELHHRTYERLGCERLSDLHPLCPSCHELIHQIEREGQIGLDLNGFFDPKRAAEYEQTRADRLDAEQMGAVRERPADEFLQARRQASARARRQRKVVSAEKYAELKRRYGSGPVGLMYRVVPPGSSTPDAPSDHRSSRASVG